MSRIPITLADVERLAGNPQLHVDAEIVVEDKPACDECERPADRRYHVQVNHDPDEFRKWCGQCVRRKLGIDPKRLRVAGPDNMLSRRLIEALDFACEELATMDYSPRILADLRGTLAEARRAQSGGAV